MLLNFIRNSTTVFTVRLRAVLAFLLFSDSEHNFVRKGNCKPTVLMLFYYYFWWYFSFSVCLYLHL